MLVGQSLFQSLLDRLGSDEEEKEAAEAPAAHRIAGLNSGFAAAVREGVSAAAAQPGQAYFDNLEPYVAAAAEEAAAAPTARRPESEPEPRQPEPPQPEPLAPVMPPQLARTSLEEVAEDLAIGAQDTLQLLADKRRAFAKANHPDSVAAPFRDKATIRMTLANRLIDDAIRRLAGPARRRR